MTVTPRTTVETWSNSIAATSILHLVNGEQ